MNSLISVLTQKIANEFLDDREAIAFGRTGHVKLRALLGSNYRIKGQIKGRIMYQVISDAKNGCAILVELPVMARAFEYKDMREAASEVPTVVADSGCRIVARSQPISFTKSGRYREKGTYNHRSNAMSIALAFTLIDGAGASLSPSSSVTSPISSPSGSSSYRIGAEVHIRIARSDNPRQQLSECCEQPWGCEFVDSENERNWDDYNVDQEKREESDDGREGRPELAHFDFLPKTVKQLDISKTILLSPHVTMSTLNRVESLTLGALWPWQLTPTTANTLSSYWPPHLKRLKFKACIQRNDDYESYDEGENDHEYDDDGERIRFFSSIDVRTITFPSTLTELELPNGLSKLFSYEESMQLIAIQYPAGLMKLIRPFTPSTITGWHLPESLTYLECQFNPEVKYFDLGEWQLPSGLLTLIFTSPFSSQLDLAPMVLPARLTSLTILGYGYGKCSLASLVLPSTLIEFNYDDDILIPRDLSHTVLRSFTVHRLDQLSSFTLPETIEQITFSYSTHLPKVDAEYVWPPHVREVHIQSNFACVLNEHTKGIPNCHLPDTLRRLVVRTPNSEGPFSSLIIREGLESLSINASHSVASWSSLVLPSSLTQFEFECRTSNASIQLPALGHTHIHTLHLPAFWNRPLTTDEFVLPETLTSLRFGYEFDQPLDQLRLPAGLTELQFGPNFSQSLAPLTSQIPQQLRIFTLGTENGTTFSHLASLMDLPLPATLCELILPSPRSPGIVLSPLHTRYTDFVAKLQERVLVVKLLESPLLKESFV